MVFLFVMGSLNAPFGARCFLTPRNRVRLVRVRGCLNAPFGARCFLTRHPEHVERHAGQVLMNLLALGAF